MGTNLDGLALEVQNSLKRFDYESMIFPATEAFKITHHEEYDCLIDGDNEYERISKFMDWGNDLRRDSNSNDILVKYLVSKIKKEREEKKDLISWRAFILKNLKHPDEVNTLRNLYKDSFYLIGLWSDENSRKQFLRGHRKYPF